MSEAFCRLLIFLIGLAGLAACALTVGFGVDVLNDRSSSFSSLMLVIFAVFFFLCAAMLLVLAAAAFFRALERK